MKRALVLLLLAGSAWGQELVFQQLPATQRLSGRSGPVTVERRSGVTPITTGSIQVTIASDSPQGEVSATPEPWGLWGPTLQLPIGPGASRTAAFYVRDGRVGTTRWSASAGGFTAADGGMVVRTDAITCDVETGTLLDTEVPAGCFNTRYLPYPASSIAPSMQSAHRGSFGVLLSDMEMGVGDAADTALYEDGAPVFGDYFARSWVRVRSSNTVGTVTLVQLTNAQATSPSIVDVRLSMSSGLLSVGGFVADANYILTPGDAGVMVGDWHLLELLASGVGTSDAGRRLWLDGRLVVDDRGLDFSGGRLAVARLAIGEPYAQDRAWQGLIDFDDVRSGAVPLATSLRLSTAAGAVGECVQVEVDLVSSQSGAPVLATEAFDFSVDAGATVFSDSACAVPGPVVSFTAGQSRKTFSIRPVAMMTALAVTTPDLLGATADYVFSAAVDAGSPDAGVPDAGPVDAGVVDAGSPDAGGVDSGVPDAGAPDADAGVEAPMRLGVGCACAETDGALLWVLFGALCRLRRSRAET